MNKKNKKIKIIDTAGIGKKYKIKKKSVNDYSVKKSFQNIADVNGAIIIIDSSEGIDRQDKRIIKMILESSESVILIFNKFDLILNKDEYRSNIISDIKYSFSEINNIKVFFISALSTKSVIKVLDYINNSIFQKNSKISTSQLNSWLKKTVNNYQHPLVENKKVNFKYAVQIKESPVSIKVFCNYSNRVKVNYKRYLVNNFNNHFKILNQKTRFVFSSSDNPYI